MREKGNDANVGLTTVLLLLQPKWQALACVPIPILCSSFRVLEKHEEITDKGEERSCCKRMPREHTPPE